eukprot:14250853-Alexandrium_andersonii.AAC.1
MLRDPFALQLADATAQDCGVAGHDGFACHAPPPGQHHTTSTSSNAWLPVQGIVRNRKESYGIVRIARNRKES